MSELITVLTFLVTHPGLTVVRVDNSVLTFLVTHPGLTVVRVDNSVLTFLVTHPGLIAVRVDNHVLTIDLPQHQSVTERQRLSELITLF